MSGRSPRENWAPIITRLVVPAEPYEIGAPVKTSPAVAGDWVIFGADDGQIYAFKAGAGQAK